MEQQNEPRLTKAEKRIIAELRQLKYGEMRIVMRNGVPVQLESTRSEKLEEKGLEAPGENQLSEMRQASHSK